MFNDSYNLMKAIFGEKEEKEEKIEIEETGDNVIENDNNFDIEISEELPEIEIEEVTERKKKSGLKKLLEKGKNFFKKNDYELPEIDIEEVTERKKVKKENIFKRLIKKIFMKKVEVDNEELTISEKIDKYLENTYHTDIADEKINEKLLKIYDNNYDPNFEQLHSFLDNNMNANASRKYSKLMNKLNSIINNNEYENTDVKDNDDISSQITYNIDKNDNTKQSNYIVNNHESNVIVEDNKNEVEQELMRFEAQDKIEEKKQQIRENIEKIRARKALKQERNKKLENKKEINEINNEMLIEKERKLHMLAYKKYNENLSKLDDKASELDYLKNEYKVIEKSIYGINLTGKEDIEVLKEISLSASKEQLQCLKEKLNEIKEVENDIDVLITKINSYKNKFGSHEDAEKMYSDMFNDAFEEKQRQEKINDSKELFEEFSDSEMKAIYKYMEFQKTK